ncbi:MAG: ribosomal protein [Candidatus Parcubacteria bacterium]|jgi:small subunit ribosomal protein S17
MSDKITTSKSKNNRTLKGIVVSTAMQKTVVVAVSRTKSDPLYKKRYKITKRYKAHNDNGSIKVGDEVTIKESRPLSRHKKWIVI